MFIDLSILLPNLIAHTEQILIAPNLPNSQRMLTLYEEALSYKPNLYFGSCAPIALKYK
jgi:hypothetical protein